MAADFEAILTALLSTDNQVRKQAEEAVQNVASRPEVVAETLQHVQHAANPEVRQLAAVLLRKWVPRHWAKLPAEVKSGAQQVLLERIAHEPVHSVRRALADVVAATARLTVPEGQWPGLMDFLHQCSRADSADHREVGLLLFAALFETIGDHLQPHVPAILQALAAGAGHPSAAVQAAALSAVEPLLPFITDAHVPAFHSLLGALLPCAHAALAAGNEELLVQLCQVLVEVAECPAPLLQPCLQQVLEMCMTVATNKQFESDTRERALHLLHWMAKYKPKQLTRLKPLMRAIVDALCEMLCEPKPADYDDAQELPPQKAAAQALDVLAIAVASQHVFPAVWQFAQAAAASPDPNRRHAAMLGLAVMAEGCAEPLRKRLQTALPLVLSLLSDGSSEVRGAAAFALGQFSEYLVPDVMQHYKDVMPAVFRLLRDPDQEVQERACYALDAFCESLDAAEILPYMPQLISELLQVLQMGRPGVQEMALSAVSSIAAAAEQAFQPYTAQMLPVLQHFMQHPGKEHLLCRCRAIEAAGIIVSSLGAKDPVIGPHIAPMMEAVLAGYAAADSSELREYSHTMFGNVARALGEDFAPYLGHVVGLAYASCRQEDGAELVGDVSSESDGDEDLGSDESSDDEGGGRNFNVRTGVMDEKASATAALGWYAEACPRAFMPYAEECLQVLTTMSEYWHEEARAAAFDSLQKLALAAHSAFPPAGGEPVVLSQQTQVLSEQVLPLLISCVEEDCSKPAVAAAAAALAQLLKQLGRGAVGPTFLEGASNMAQLVLQNKAVCQEVEDDDEDDAVDDEDVAAEDEELLGAAADLLPALAASMGPDAYAAVFLSLHAEPLLARLRPQQPAALRAIAAGAAAEVAESLGPRIAAVVEPLMTLMLRELQTEDDINRQNAAFCAGLLVEASPEKAAQQVMPLLAALHNMFRPEEAAGARDNAVGAVGRILSSSPPGALPLGQVLPVLLGALPLKEDLSETTPAVAALCKLLLSDQLSEIQQFVPQIVQVFGQVAVQIAAPTEAKVGVAQTLMNMQAKYHGQMAPLLAQLPQEQQAALQMLVSS
uniref:Importin N-terminal domain-containing protein n=1 Tax=Tetradesmus obliquus TaxID=3088 RepID=A0A383W429_TETOB|eukprot:jgi/Sobl393_1/1505/SZX72231.1